MNEISDAAFLRARLLLKAIAYGVSYPHSASLRSAPLPLKRGEEGSQDRGRRFLSPVDRGRGGARSATEWGAKPIGNIPQPKGGNVKRPTGGVCS